MNFAGGMLAALARAARCVASAGVIIGAAFGRIVKSLVTDVVMPLIGAVTGGLDFSNCHIPLSKAIHTDMTYDAAKKVGALIGYGEFLTVALNFLIIAWVLFIVIKQFERLKSPAPDAPPPPPTGTEEFPGEIRDALRARS